MKRFLKIFSILCILLIAMLAMSSCVMIQEKRLLLMDEASRGEKLYEIAQESLKSKDKCKITIDSYLETALNGLKLSEETQTVIAYIDDKNGLVYQERAAGKTTYGSVLTESLMINGYKDGYMYRVNSLGGTTSRFKSPLSERDYKKHMAGLESNTSFQIDKNGCKSIKVTKNEDGTWCATFSSFTEENILLLLKDIGNVSSIFSPQYEIADIVVSITTDSDFNLKAMNMSFVFEKKQEGGVAQMSDSDTSPMPVLQTEYKVEWENDIVVTDDIDIEYKAFNEVDDLRYLDNVKSELYKIKNAEQAKAEVSIRQEVRVGNRYSISEEDDVIYYGFENGQLSYEIESMVNAINYQVIYEDGKEKVYDESGKTVRETSKTNLEAISFLNSLLDRGSFDPYNVKKIQATEDGGYTYTLRVSEQAFSDFAQSYNGTVTSSTVSITVKMEEGKLVSYDTYLKIGIRIPSIGTIYVEQIMKCTYEY